MVYIPVRYVTVAILIIAGCITYISRINISMAMVSMTEQKREKNSTSVFDVCPLPVLEEEVVTTTHPLLDLEFTTTMMTPIDVTKPTRLRDKRYDWSQSVQGYILGGFFVAYISFHLFLANLSQRFGGRIIILIGLTGACLASVATPFVTDYVILLIGVRFILGSFQAGIFPAAFLTICKWSPLRERSTAFALLEFGKVFGIIVTFYCSGWIAKHYGWPALFIIPGVLCGITVIIMLIGLRNSPEECSFVSKRELKYLDSLKSEEEGHQEDEEEEGQKLPTPWSSILTNRCILAAAFYRFALQWNENFFASKIPSYLDTILHEDIEENSHVNAYINVITSIVLMIVGYISEKIIQRKWLTRTNTRKMFSLVTGLMNGLCIGLIPLAGCDAKKVHLILYISAVLSGFSTGSQAPLPSEFSKNFPAVIYALLNMTAQTSGFLAPGYTGIVLDSVADKWVGWSIVFYSTCGLTVAANIVFLIFVKAERQPFDYVDKTIGAKDVIITKL